MDNTKAVHQEETIAAISTPRGEGGIGLVRLSGAGAIDILTSMFRNPSGKPRNNFESHKVYFGYVVDADENRIDETMATAMMAPRTYTREDVVEISCHGGTAVLNKTLSRVLQLGARSAEPGEFSKRAFLNGRIDLLQAESIIDLIRSKSEKSWKTAFSQLDGKLSDTLAGIENNLISIITAIETSIDFPDEELEIAADKEILNNLEKLKSDIEKLSKTYGVGRIYREGIAITIAGSPNVGKSSLMNALLERDRVIVDDTPGTTRDTVEETLHINGISVRIIDTAGVREASEKAEKLGIERAIQSAQSADLALVVFDGSRQADNNDMDLLEKLLLDKEKIRLIPVVNKTDMDTKINIEKLENSSMTPISRISAKYGDGIEKLKERISSQIESLGENAGDGPLLTRERHLLRLEEMSESVGRAIEAVHEKLSREFVAADLQSARESLEELTGKVVDEQVLEKIFSEFCIGK